MESGILYAVDPYVHFGFLFFISWFNVEDRLEMLDQESTALKAAFDLISQCSEKI